MSPLRTTACALGLALASALPALAIADEPAAPLDTVAALAADPRVALGTLEVDDSDGSLLLREASGDTLLRLPVASIDGASCRREAFDPASVLELATVSGHALHLFRGESRTLAVALTRDDLWLLEWDAAEPCWRRRSLFDVDAFFRRDQILIEARVDASGTDYGAEEAVVGPFRATAELDPDAPGDEQLVLEGTALRVERADGTPMIAPLRLPDLDTDLGPELEYEVALGRLDDGRIALYVRSTREDAVQSTRDERLTRVLALEDGALVPVLVREQHDNYSLESQASDTTWALARRDRDGRTWTVTAAKSHHGGSFPDMMLGVRGRRVCELERYESFSSFEQTWQLQPSASEAPHELAARKTNAHDQSEDRGRCSSADDALLAALSDLRAELPERLVGARFVYQVERSGLDYRDEAGDMSYHVVREVEASTRADDGALVLELEERGGAETSARSASWIVDARCLQVRGPGGEHSACRPELEADTEILDVGADHAILLTGEEYHDRAAWLPGVGPHAFETRDEKRGLAWEYELVGARLPDGTEWGEEAALEPLVCDWDASEKARDGAIELALSSTHAVASRLVVEPGPGGSGMLARLLAADDSEALRLESESATLVRAKRWRDPAAGHETVVLQAEGDAGLEVHVLTLEGTQATPTRLDFAPGDDGERDFATLLVATPEACALRVVRGKDDKSRVADYGLTASGPQKRVHTGKLLER